MTTPSNNRAPVEPVRAADGERRSLLAPGTPRWPKDPARPIVELHHVNKSYDGIPVLRDLSLEIPTGQTTVVIGQSGSGKSVLLKHMNGLLRPDAGEVILFGQRLNELSETVVNSLRKRTGMVLQNYALIDSINVLENVAFPLVENTRMGRVEIDERVMDLLEMLNIAEAAKRLPSELSGGMKKRVSFARAVITEPELVLFDEPTTGLDPVMIEFVDRLIEQMRDRFAITSVIISHDIASVFALADRIAMLDGGQIIAEGTPEEIRASEVDQVKRFISVGGSGRLGSSGAHDTDAEAEDEDPAASKSFIQVVDLHKRFGDNHVLRGVNLEVFPREITVIIGGSGSGKSVMMKHILGLFRPTSGAVWYEGKNLNDMSERELQQMRTGIGMLFQGAALFDSMSIEENIAFPLVERGGKVSRKEVNQKVKDVMERLRIEEIGPAFPSEVSAGQKKRVGLARAIVTRPKLMIYDEPTTGQDPIMIKYVDELIIEAHNAFDLTTMVISHDMQSTFRVADKIAMVYHGQIAAYGTPDELRASEKPEVREFIFAGS